MTDRDRAERATLVLEILRALDAASLDEVRVARRVVERLEVIRIPSTGLRAAIDRSELDSALILELTDLRIEPPAPRPCRCGHDLDRHRTPGCECVVDGCDCSTHTHVGGDS